MNKMYDLELKKKVVKYAEMTCNAAAERRYKVSEANIRRWRKLKESMFFEETEEKCGASKRILKIPKRYLDESGR